MRTLLNLDGDQAHRILETLESMGILVHTSKGEYTLSTSGVVSQTEILETTDLRTSVLTLLGQSPLTVKDLAEKTGATHRRVRYLLDQLEAEGSVYGRGKKPIQWAVVSTPE
ncbi:MAG: hypothetical protein Q4A31_12065 [Corynebacterium sp.]|uniref:DprA-like winged helix domain-containing protein n=1 Tax=Corynebacterium sp. TaxID=1720 RepID=UPI0026DB319C|nr:hypothetical protein [Corynebacterium sp.]MDO4762649.1 hypothetical protein [Corynebacterium sp.]